MNIYPVKEASERALKAINHLMPQLNPNALPLSMSDLAELLKSDVNHLLFAEVAGEIAGMMTLVVFRNTVGIKARFEDVVVDQKFRGQNIAKAMCDHAIECAKSLGASSIELTTNPLREAANALYPKCGFELKKTNVYCLKLF